MKKREPILFTKMPYRYMLRVAGGIIFSKFAITKATEVDISLKSFIARNKCSIEINDIPDKFGRIYIFGKNFCEEEGVELCLGQKIASRDIYRSLLRVLFLLDKKVDLDYANEVISIDGQNYFIDDFKADSELDKESNIVTFFHREYLLKKRGFKNIHVPEIAKEPFVKSLFDLIRKNIHPHEGKDTFELFNKQILNVEKRNMATHFLALEEVRKKKRQEKLLAKENEEKTKEEK